MAGFWTTHSPVDARHSVTLCEAHALPATNAVLRAWGYQPVKSVEEAAILMSAQAAAYGISLTPLTHSETGECSACKEERDRG